jgi:hypothetical protein
VFASLSVLVDGAGLERARQTVHQSWRGSGAGMFHPGMFHSGSAVFRQQGQVDSCRSGLGWVVFFVGGG